METGNDVKSRLICYLDSKGISKAEFGRTIGVSGAYITSMRKSIQPDKLKRIAEAYPDLNRDWLLYGAGSMFATDTTADYMGTATALLPDGVVTVRFFDVNPTATFQEMCDGFSTGSEQYEIIPNRGEKIDASYAVFEIHGESMEPTIRNHARILCKEIPETHWQDADGVVVISYRDRVVVKRIVSNDIENTNCLVLASDNPNPRYGKEMVQLSDIHAIFKAKRKISEDIF